MAAEAEASVRKRKAGDDADAGSSVEVDVVESVTPEPPSTEEIPKSSDDAALNSNPNPSESFLFEDDYGYSCSCVDDGDIMKQYTDIRAVEAAKIPYLGDKVDRPYWPRLASFNFRLWICTSSYSSYLFHNFSFLKYACLTVDIMGKNCTFLGKGILFLGEHLECNSSLFC